MKKHILVLSLLLTSSFMLLQAGKKKPAPGEYLLRDSNGKEIVYKVLKTGAVTSVMKKIKRKHTRWCPHCKEYVSASTKAGLLLLLNAHH